MPGRRIRDVADARACLAAASSSGLSRADWARAHGVNARSLNAWRVNLERKTRRRQRLTFLELVADTTEVAVTSPSTLRLGVGDVWVEVPADFDEAHLRRVLQVVATC